MRDWPTHGEQGRHPRSTFSPGKGGPYKGSFPTTPVTDSEQHGLPRTSSTIPDRHRRATAADPDRFEQAAIGQASGSGRCSTPNRPTESEWPDEVTSVADCDAMGPKVR
ncbi:hypothetical protein GCM10009779_38250 [Polymorphospora rubra]|uniref:Uncharacterized protein n=1 Tax=Polymorphospora rubra TaxID=338584 RepID=A0A810NE13_9ACTN|nr:hypothetical protein Prubr_65460 [Polymorphospora rubra]